VNTAPLPSDPRQKREFVRAMFDRIAPRYDLVNRLISLGLDQGWRRSLLERIGVGPGTTVLDLATGTGDLARLAARRGARAIGVDFAAEMLRVGRRRDASLPVVQADGVALPLADASVDAVTCGFAVRNFSDLDAVLRECARVLRPGGHLGLLEVDAPRSRWLRIGHRLHFEALVPRIGALLSDADAYRYLPASAVYLPDEEGLRRRLETAGFRDVDKRVHGAGAVQAVVAVRGPSA
jgi:demethylmenaquinone methyltransferase/2-methoxy-6-polyprenyl-1,4-benzoquinol methylase